MRRGSLDKLRPAVAQRHQPILIEIRRGVRGEGHTRKEHQGHDDQETKGKHTSICRKARPSANIQLVGFFPEPLFRLWRMTIMLRALSLRATTSPRRTR